jgi:hypothetical protein
VDVAQDPDAIEREIERSRAQLAETVDAIADRVSPRRVARRTADRAAAAVQRARESVLGRVSELKALPSSAGTNEPAASIDRPAGRTDWTGAVSTGSARTVSTGGVNARLGAAISEARQLAARGRSWLSSNGPAMTRSALRPDRVGLAAAMLAAAALVTVVRRRR